MDPTEALIAVSAVHAGFQLVVSVVVYPSLADSSVESWPATHEAHSRRISFLVVPLYGLLLVVSAWVLASGPGALAVTSVVANLLAVGITATVAAPTHGRLGREGRTSGSMARLLWSDRVRTLCAVVALAAALL